jgi:DNA invertase Pin-like site-specific DNA recombinase
VDSRALNQPKKELYVAEQLRAVVYHRVSTLDQDPTAARAELRQAAAARAMTIVEEIEETGSGARNDRPGLARVMDLSRRGRIDAVVCWKLDRFGRSAHDLLANINTLSDEGVRFIAVSQSLDIKPNGDAMSRLILTVLSGVAEFERELIRERTRLGLTKARAAGKMVGRRVSRDAPDPRTVRSLRAAGRSWREIGTQLGCTASAARRAVERLVENGTGARGAK